MDNKSRDIKKISQSTNKLDTFYPESSPFVNVDEIVPINLKTEAAGDEVEMAPVNKHDSIDHLMDNHKLKSPLSKSYSSFVPHSSFKPHKLKKGLHMPERTECHELKEMYQTRLGKEHTAHDYKIYSDHINGAKLEPT